MPDEKGKAALSPYLTRTEAADYLRASLSTFDRNVRDYVPCYRVGNRVLYKGRDLESWLEKQKVGPCKQTNETERSSRSSVSRERLSDDRPAQLARLKQKAKRLASTGKR